jgi:hypothetical protein
MAPTKPLIALLALLASGVSACDRYLDRRDQVTFGTGDSIAANRAAQIIDPWPAAARTIEHGISGEQAEEALARMRNVSKEKNAPEKSASPPTLTITPTQVPSIK